MMKERAQRELVSVEIMMYDEGGGTEGTSDCGDNDV